MSKETPAQKAANAALATSPEREPVGWQRTTYALTIYQDKGASIPDQGEMMALLDSAFDGENPPSYQSFHVEQGETVNEPTPEQEAMRRRVYRALSETGPMSPGPLLFDFAKTVLMGVDEAANSDWYGQDPTDCAHEIADSAVPVYTTDQIALFTESADLATWEPEIPGGEDNGVAEVAGRVLYDLARSIADAAITERREREEAEREIREERANQLRDEAWFAEDA